MRNPFKNVDFSVFKVVFAIGAITLANIHYHNSLNKKAPVTRAEMNVSLEFLIKKKTRCPVPLAPGQCASQREPMRP
jgi:hypothetical protein